MHSHYAFWRWRLEPIATGRTVKECKNCISACCNLYTSDQGSHCHIVKKNAARQVTAHVAFGMIQYGVLVTEQGKAKSPLVGKLTNEFVYNYLPEGVLQELRTKNPKNASGHRKSKHHQYLADTGAKHLDNLLQQELALMKASDDWEEFVRLFKKSMDEPYQLPIEETESHK